jgi:hypothetical protein
VNATRKKSPAESIIFTDVISKTFKNVSFCIIFYRYQSVISYQSHYAIDVCIIWRTSMTSGRGVSMQLLFWRAVLGSQKGTLKWYKPVVVVVLDIVIVRMC